MRSICWNHFILCCFILGAFGMLGDSAEVQAYSFWQNDGNGRIRHWDRERLLKGPLSIVLHESGCPSVAPEALKQTINLVLGTWNAVTCTLARLRNGGIVKGTNAPVVDGINMIKFVTASSEWQWGTGNVLIVIMETSTRTGKIRDADIMFNSRDFKFSTHSKTEFDLQSVLTHAMGRVWGLGYSKDKNAVMYGRINPGETGKRALSQDDKDAICSLYPKDASCKGQELVGNDLVCFNGRPAPICAPYSQLCKACSRDEDCRGDNNYCLFNINGGRCGMDCAGTRSCPKGYSCRERRDSGGQKVVGYNCMPDDNTCVDAAAVPCCRSLNDCFPGFTCESEVCIKATISDPCKGACQPYEVCENAACVIRTCSNNDQCGINWSCVQGRCVKDGGCAGGCSDGQVCIEGRCAAGVGAACKINDDCARGLYCGTGGGFQFCTKSCTSASDCGNGEFCVQGLGGDVNSGCWPSSRSSCKDGKCNPKSSGCNCSSTGQPPLLEGLLLLLALFFMRFFRNRKIRFSFHE